MQVLLRMAYNKYLSCVQRLTLAPYENDSYIFCDDQCPSQARVFPFQYTYRSYAHIIYMTILSGGITLQQQHFYWRTERNGKHEPF